MDALALRQYHATVEHAEQDLARAIAEVERHLSDIRDGRDRWRMLAHDVALGAQHAATLKALREVSYLTEEQ